jgi:hypothetical protein
MVIINSQEIMWQGVENVLSIKTTPSMFRSIAPIETSRRASKSAMSKSRQLRQGNLDYNDLIPLRVPPF